MPQFETKKRVRHSAQAMFDLVMDIEKYPEFVPLCHSLSIRSREENENGEVVVVADMTVAYKMIQESFTSRVTAHPETRKILVEYIEGPFRKLENRWSFTPVDDNRCDVGFSLKYEFKNRALAMLMGAMFDRAFRKFSSAFEARANQIHGRTRTNTAASLPLSNELKSQS